MSADVAAAAISLKKAALCLDCEHVIDGEAGKYTCPRCASEALLWLKAVLDREPELRR